MIFGLLFDKCLFMFQRTLTPNAHQNGDFVPTPFFLLLFIFSIVLHRCFQQTMSLSSSVHDDVEGVWNRGEGGGRLRQIDSGIPSTTTVVAHCKPNGNRLDVQGFRSVLLHG